MASTNNAQQTDHSKITPGEVRDKEDILLAIIEPTNWENGTYSNQGFQKKHLKARALSVARQPYSSPKRLDFFVIDLFRAKSGRVIHGVTRFNARALREISNEIGEKQFVILDAPIPVRKKIDFAHAHVGFSDSTIKKGSNEQTAAVLNLRQLLEEQGLPKDPKKQFSPFPFLYFRWSEVRLLMLKLKISITGDGRRFLALSEPSPPSES